MSDITEQASTTDGWGLISNLCQRAKKNSHFRRALNKLSNMNENSIVQFLLIGKTVRYLSFAYSFGFQKIPPFKVDEFFWRENFLLRENFIDLVLSPLKGKSVASQEESNFFKFGITQHVADQELMKDFNEAYIPVSIFLANLKPMLSFHEQVKGLMLDVTGKTNLFYVDLSEIGNESKVVVGISWYRGMWGVDASIIRSGSMKTGWNAGFYFHFSKG